MTWFAALAQTRAALFSTDLAVVLLWIASISLTIATWQAARNMPSHRNGNDPSSTAIAWQIVVPLLLWAGLVPLVLVAGGYKAKPDVMFSDVRRIRTDPVLVDRLQLQRQDCRLRHRRLHESPATFFFISGIS